MFTRLISVWYMHQDIDKVFEIFNRIRGVYDFPIMRNASYIHDIKHKGQVVQLGHLVIEVHSNRLDALAVANAMQIALFGQNIQNKTSMIYLPFMDR